MLTQEIGQYQQFNQDDMFKLKQSMYKIEVHDKQIGEDEAKLKDLTTELAELAKSVETLSSHHGHALRRSQTIGDQQSQIEKSVVEIQAAFKG